jgi:ankyrin repeat protein
MENWKDVDTLLEIIYSNDERKLSQLIENGLSIADEVPEEGYGALHYAAELGRLGLVHLFLKAGGENSLNKFDDLSNTPLIYASMNNHAEVAKALIDAGAEVNLHDEPKIGDTALREAVTNGALETVEILLKAGADPLIEGWMRLTPLHIAKERVQKSGDVVSQQILTLLENAVKGRTSSTEIETGN